MKWLDEFCGRWGWIIVPVGFTVTVIVAALLSGCGPAFEEQLFAEAAPDSGTSETDTGAAQDVSNVIQDGSQPASDQEASVDASEDASVDGCLPLPSDVAMLVFFPDYSSITLGSLTGANEPFADALVLALFDRRGLKSL